MNSIGHVLLLLCLPPIFGCSSGTSCPKYDAVVTLESDAGPVWCLAVSVDGRLLAAGFRDQSVRVIDCETWQQRASFGIGNPPVGITFCRDRSGLAVARNDGRLSIWRLPKSIVGPASDQLNAHANELRVPEALQELELGHGGSAHAYCLADDANTRMLALGVGFGVRLFINRENNTWDEQLLSTDNVLAHCLAFAANGTLLVIGGELVEPERHNVGEVYYSGPKKGRVQIFDLSAKKSNGYVPGITEVVYSLAISSKSDRLAACSPTTLTLFDIGEERFTTIWDMPIVGATHVKFSPSGRIIASGGEDHAITLWDALSGTRLAILDGHTDRISCLQFASEYIVVSGGSDGLIKVWDIRNCVK